MRLLSNKFDFWCNNCHLLSHNMKVFIAKLWLFIIILILEIKPKIHFWRFAKAACRWPVTVSNCWPENTMVPRLFVLNDPSSNVITVSLKRHWSHFQFCVLDKICYWNYTLLLSWKNFTHASCDVGLPLNVLHEWNVAFTELYFKFGTF